MFADVFDRGRIDVLSGRHGADLDSPVGNALCGYELLIQFLCGPTLLDRFHKWFVLSQSAHDIEVLCLHHVIFFSFKQMFLFPLFKIHLFLQIQRSGLAVSRLGLGGAHEGLLGIVFGLQSHNRTLLLFHRGRSFCHCVHRTRLFVLRLRLKLRLLTLLGVVLGTIYPLGHPHQQLLRWRLLWVVLLLPLLYIKLP